MSWIVSSEMTIDAMCYALVSELAETEEDKGDYQEIQANYGECVEWSATKLTHGNKQNKTLVTRVSFDFRVIPKSRYVDSNHLTINTKIPFGIGGYYEVL